MILIETNLLLM